jgi:hypothetical protein
MRSDYLAVAESAPAEVELVMVLGHSRPEREMVREPLATRCVIAGEVHELVAVDPVTLRDGRYHGASYIGFGTFTRSAVIHVGEPLLLDGVALGVVGGFDGTHLPNHLNILIETDRPAHGRDLGLVVGCRLLFAGKIARTP